MNLNIKTLRNRIYDDHNIEKCLSFWYKIFDNKKRAFQKCNIKLEVLGKHFQVFRDCFVQGKKESLRLRNYYSILVYISCYNYNIQTYFDACPVTTNTTYKHTLTHVQQQPTQYTNILLQMSSRNEHNTAPS